MKLGQLIEQNMRNVFLEKAYTKYGGESTCRPFSKKIEHTSLDFYTAQFVCVSKLRNAKIY